MLQWHIHAREGGGWGLGRSIYICVTCFTPRISPCCAACYVLHSPYSVFCEKREYRLYGSVKIQMLLLNDIIKSSSKDRDSVNLPVCRVQRDGIAFLRRFLYFYVNNLECGFSKSAICLPSDRYWCKIQKCFNVIFVWKLNPSETLQRDKWSSLREGERKSNSIRTVYL